MVLVILRDYLQLAPSLPLSQPLETACFQATFPMLPQTHSVLCKLIVVIIMYIYKYNLLSERHGNLCSIIPFGFDGSSDSSVI